MSDNDWADKFIPPPPPKPTDQDWLTKFAGPIKAASTDPQTGANIAIPNYTGKTLQVEDVILQHNQSQSIFHGTTVWRSPLKGVVIHEIDLPTAARLSTRIKPVAEANGLALTYILATLAIEGDFDPLCENDNTGLDSTGKPRSNPTNNPLLRDMGCAQLKLTFLVSGRVASDYETANAFALNPDRAIPYHGSIMAGNYDWAVNTIEHFTDSKSVDPRMLNPWVLATNAYNFGRSGVMPLFESGQYPDHGKMVVDLETAFAKQLGLQSIFASLPSV